ncbi:RNA ligase 1, partial [Sinocyclocheilus grahami]|uniref:RNA ligase 1 n=1 Tax=Sinocyclocheilus grahami TaxID=75366 RepID=UPI0007AD2C4E
MRRLGSVQQKIPCVFLTEVTSEPSRKRDCQVLISISKMRVFINITFFFLEGEPYLWARLDRKPTKQADKRFKKYQYSQKTCKGFVWIVDEDFREAPESWIAAHRVQHENGHPVPDEHGHIPGWVPVDHTNKQYCWHASVVNYDAGVALVLKTHGEDEGLLEIVSVPLADLMEQTLELIGTNVNGNPYGLGSKKHPVHVLVPHGVLRIRKPPPVEFQQLYSWFQECQEGRVEGIVWHCDDGTLVKIHRHHLSLKWPVGDTFLNTRP